MDAISTIDALLLKMGQGILSLYVSTKNTGVSHSHMFCFMKQ